MEQSKKSSLVVARSILNNKLISKKLERYLKVGVQSGCARRSSIHSRSLARFGNTFGSLIADYGFFCSV